MGSLRFPGQEGPGPAVRRVRWWDGFREPRGVSKHLEDSVAGSAEPRAGAGGSAGPGGRGQGRAPEREGRWSRLPSEHSEDSAGVQLCPPGQRRPWRAGASGRGLPFQHTPRRAGKAVLSFIAQSKKILMLFDLTIYFWEFILIKSFKRRKKNYDIIGLLHHLKDNSGKMKGSKKHFET